MRARLILVCLLVLPGFVLGPGWNLRICAGELLGLASCCGDEVVTSCCTDDAPASDRPLWQSQGQGDCEACCLDIDTSREQLAPAKADSGARELESVQLAALPVPPAASLPPAKPRTGLLPRARAPAPPGRVVPLPLRI